jgi:hypothetical protein
MQFLSLKATDDEILALCREWVELVAADRLEQAISLLYVPETYQPQQRWTADSLRTYIGNDGSWDPAGDGCVWRVTLIDSTPMPADRPNFRPRADVGHYDGKPHAGWVDPDLPLNGEWSDLTAQFEFSPVDDGIGLSLYDLHVL